MELRRFSKFRRLPAEIRCEIYILATEQRFVHVQEHVLQDCEDFEDDFLASFAGVKLHPSLAHFAPCWRHYIPRHSRPDSDAVTANYIINKRRGHQFTLEDYGFTSSKPTPQPWAETPETPRIPPAWLATQPRLAWCLVRQSYLYSKAPIPPLLHVCRESRQFLMAYGYQLAFGTRTHGPRTWFHFRDDILHLDPANFDRDDGESYVMSGSQWNVGQFLPRDLTRVQRLSISGFRMRAYVLNGLSSLMRLLGRVEELFVVEWILDDLPGVCIRLGTCLPLWKPANRLRHRQNWVWIACDDIDTMKAELRDSSCRPRRDCSSRHRYAWTHREFYMSGVAGYRHQRFWAYRTTHWNESNGYFVSMRREIADHLFEKSLQSDRLGVCWKIPGVHLVHLGTAAAVSGHLISRTRWRLALEEIRRIELEQGFPVPEMIYNEHLDSDSDY